MGPVLWNENTRKAVSRFPKEVRRELGYLLYRLQQGDTLTMPHCRPMPTVATGVCELRVKGKDGQYRLFYFAVSKQGIFAIHAFKKKSQKTPKRDLDQARVNLKELQDGR
jgi:phage-related protein